MMMKSVTDRLGSMRPSMRVILLTSGFCLLGLFLRTIWPGMILPKSSLTLYALILVLAHMSSPRIKGPRVDGFDWIVSVAALTILPACAGVNDGPLWKALLIDAVFSAGVMIALDSMDRRAELRKTGKTALLINGLLLVLAVQGFDNMFM